MDLWRLSIAETIAGYRKGVFTPEDVLDSTAARIAAVNPALNAIVTENASEVRRVAEQSTQRWKDKLPRSGVDGVFITVKDNIPVSGMRCTWGSRSYADYVPERDESPITHLRGAGVGILGKTNVPEFTLQGFTNNLVFGSTGNPWNPQLTPGGSSGGAVAAVATGMGVAAMATDGGGSIRRPCAHTGLYGLKTSPGFISRANGLPQLLGDFETMGVIARSPGDLRIVLSQAAHRHPADRASFAFSNIERLAKPKHSHRQRILYVPAFKGFPVDPEIRESVAGAAKLLESLGHNIEIGDVPFDVDRLNSIWNLIGPAGLAWLVDSGAVDLSLAEPSLVPMVEHGRQAKASSYIQLLADVQEFRNDLRLLFERYDFILTPSVAALPWPRTQSHPDTIDGIGVGPRGHAVFTPFVNAGGLPAINLPTAQSKSGLPIGCQLVGSFRSDLLLISMAEAYEEAFGPYRWPEL